VVWEMFTSSAEAWSALFVRFAKGFGGFDVDKAP
jgi:hypothetical protein